MAIIISLVFIYYIINSLYDEVVVIINLPERHYWTEGWVHLILSAEILSDHRTSENEGSVHFSSEAGSIFTF
jgi:hypothetical protein